MKAWAVVAHGRPLECVDLPDLTPTGTQVIVRVTRCGVCHSDLHLWHGFYDLGGGRRLTVAERGLTLPAAPGHEIVGRVVRMGPDAEGVAIGDARVVYPWIGCGTCARCLAGEDNLCTSQRSLGVSTDGGFASEVIVPHPRYLFAFGGLDPSLAATYACSGLTAYGAVRKALPLAPQEPVVVLGAGGLGIAGIATLRALGHERIVAVDIGADKRRAALEAGASAAVDGAGPNVADRIREAAGGPIPAVIDFVGMSSTVETAYAILAKCGKLILVGVGGGELTVSVAGAIFRSLTIVGSLTGSLADLREVLDLAEAGRLRPIPINDAPVEAVNDVVLALERGAVTGRAVLVHAEDG